MIGPKEADAGIQTGHGKSQYGWAIKSTNRFSQ
jgi:hypothetical protein